MDTKKLEAKIDAVISSRKQSAQEMRGVLIELLLHVYKHGNYPIANRLLSGVKNTKDYKPIVDWVEAFIHLEINNGVATGWKGSEAIKQTYPTACATDWQNFKPKKEDKPLDAGKSIANLTKRISEALKNGQDGTDGNEYSFGFGGIGGIGGQAGNAVIGNSLITWVNMGTIYGATS